LRVLRRYFLTGLAILLPMVITIFVLAYITQLIYKPLAPIVDKWVGDIFHVPIPGVGLFFSLLLVIGIVIAIGFIGSTIVGRRFIKWWDLLLAQLPIVRVVYSPARQVVHLLTQPKMKQPGKPVLVFLPNAGIYMVGFLTGSVGNKIKEALGRDAVTVFLPSTPTPLTGFTLIVPEENIVQIDISLEEALKFIVSGGVLKPDMEAEEEILMLPKEEHAEERLSRHSGGGVDDDSFKH